MAAELKGRCVRVLVLVLGSQEITLEGLKLLLHECPECAMVKGAGSLPAAEASLADFNPELILVGFGPPLCLVHATRRLRALAPEALVIALSTDLRDPEMAQLLDSELRAAGAAGLLPCTITSTHLREAVRACLAGQLFVQARAEEAPARSARSVTVRPPAVRSVLGHDSLTQRQTQVLRLVAEGRLNKEIADQLGISIKTVEKHRQSVKERLHAANTADLTRRAIELGLTAAVAVEDLPHRPSVSGPENAAS